MAAAKKPRSADKRTKAKRAADAKAVVASAAEELNLDPNIGEDGKPMTAHERHERNLNIFRASLRGTDIYDLAQIYSLHPGTVQEIINGCKVEGQRLSDTNPLTVIEDWIMRNAAGISELAALGAREKGSARIGAITARLGREDKHLEVLQAIGLLPHDLGEMRQQLNGIQLANRMLDILDEANLLTPDLMDRIAIEFKGSTVEGIATEVPESAAA